MASDRRDDLTEIGKRSPRWSFMERFTLPGYLTRLRIFQTPLLGVFTHRFIAPDKGPLHDHPYDFLSIVLRGGYTEQRLDLMTGEVYEREVKRFNRMRTHDFHKIVRLHRTPTWTLMIVGRRYRRWGFIEGGRNTMLWTESEEYIRQNGASYS